MPLIRLFLLASLSSGLVFAPLAPLAATCGGGGGGGLGGGMAKAYSPSYTAMSEAKQKAKKSGGILYYFPPLGKAGKQKDPSIWDKSLKDISAKFPFVKVSPDAYRNQLDHFQMSNVRFPLIVITDEWGNPLWKAEVNIRPGLIRAGIDNIAAAAESLDTHLESEVTKAQTAFDKSRFTTVIKIINDNKRYQGRAGCAALEKIEVAVENNLKNELNNISTLKPREQRKALKTLQRKYRDSSASTHITNALEQLP